MDSVTLLLIALLAATLLAFVFGWFPYPFGWLVITLFLVARVLHQRQTRRSAVETEQPSIPDNHARSTHHA